MNTKRRIIMIAGGIGALILVADGVISSIDINSYKPKIETSASEAIGLKVTIGGRIGLSLFPFGASAGDIRIGNKSGGIISVERLEIGLELMPLLKRQIKVKQCDLLRPTFTIIRDAGGKFNFEGAGGSSPSRPSEALHMNEMRLSNGTIVYLDEKTGEKTELRDLTFVLKDLTIANISGDLMKNVSFTGEMECKEVLQKDLRIDNFKVAAKADKGVYSFNPLTIGTLVLSDKKTGEKTELKGMTLVLKDLTMANISGDLIKGASFAGEVECKEVLQKDLRIDNFKVAAKADKGVYSFNPLTIGTLVLSDKKTGEKTELKDIKLDASKLSIDYTSEDIVKDLSLTGKIECKEVRVNELIIDNVQGLVKAEDGVYHLKPFAANIFGARGEGDLTADLSGLVDEYKVRLRVSDLDFEKLTEAFGKKKVIGGKGYLIASVSMKKQRSNDIMSSLDGEFSLRGNNLILYTMDLDKVLSKVEETQNFNLIDIGAFFIAGPLGTAATKGVGFGSLYRGVQGGRSTISEFVSNWKIKKGVAESTDCALATQHHRVALRGKLDLVKNRYDNVIVAILNEKGCADFSQKVNGPFGNPQIGAISTVQSIAGPILNLLSKAKGLIQGGSCYVFYNGSVQQPH